MENHYSPFQQPELNDVSMQIDRRFDHENHFLFNLCKLAPYQREPDAITASSFLMQKNSFSFSFMGQRGRFSCRDCRHFNI
jgi:hypothetical protein